MCARHNAALLSNLYNKLRRAKSAGSSVAESTDSIPALQATLESLKIVARATKTVARVDLPPKKHLSKAQRAYYVRRARRLAKENPAGRTKTMVLYKKGKSLKLLMELPFMLAVIEAYAASAARDGGPLILQIVRAMELVPRRFGLTIRALEHAFDVLGKLATPIAGTDAPDSSYHATASIRLNEGATVLSGRAILVTQRLMRTMRAFDAVGMYTLRIIAGCVHRRERFGFVESPNASAFLASLAKVLKRPAILDNKKHILSVFYKPDAVLEAHRDTSLLATFITTRTPNPGRHTLLNIADDTEGEEMKHSIAYHRWDLVFFPALLYHKTTAFPAAREIMNLFY